MRLIRIINDPLEPERSDHQRKLYRCDCGARLYPASAKDHRQYCSTRFREPAKRPHGRPRKPKETLPEGSYGVNPANWSSRQRRLFTKLESVLEGLQRQVQESRRQRAF